MAPRCCRATAPGKLMILGEHAVLHGQPAIVAAVNQRLSVTVTPRRDHKLLLASGPDQAVLGLDNLAGQKWSRFLVGVLRHLRTHLTSGFDIIVQADFDSRLGLGSSAAVTVATLAALARALGLPGDRAWLLSESLAVVRAVQGSGSGADLAASIHGGVLSYRADTLEVEALAPDLPLTVVYSGIKASTPEVIAQVEGLRRRQPGVTDGIYAAMGRSAELAAAAIGAGDWTALGELMDVNRSLMAALGVSSPELDALAARLRALPGIAGVKLSGAGMGDCLIGLGTADATGIGEPLDLRVSPAGVEVTE